MPKPLLNMLISSLPRWVSIPLRVSLKFIEQKLNVGARMKLPIRLENGRKQAVVSADFFSGKEWKWSPTHSYIYRGWHEIMWSKSGGNFLHKSLKIWSCAAGTWEGAVKSDFLVLIYIYIYMCVCICLYIYIYTYILMVGLNLSEFWTTIGLEIKLEIETPTWRKFSEHKTHYWNWNVFRLSKSNNLRKLTTWNF